jgi:ectoine hydroxylase
MNLATQEIERYDRDGFLFFPDCLSAAEVDVLKCAMARELSQESERNVKEKDGKAVRSVYGSHLSNDVFARLARHPRLLNPARQLLSGEVYVYQFKINAKVGFAGDVWQWHQDYVFWLSEDGLPTPRLTNVVVYLDEVNEFNGPMILVPGSHQAGVLTVEPLRDRPAGYADQPDWISNLTADLKYSVDKPTLIRLLDGRGMEAPKGPAGSVLLFHPSLVHGSAQNMSPHDRNIVIITYSRVDNVPQWEARPEFLVSRDFRPLSPLADDALAVPGAAAGAST